MFSAGLTELDNWEQMKTPSQNVHLDVLLYKKRSVHNQSSHKSISVLNSEGNIP